MLLGPYLLSLVQVITVYRKSPFTGVEGCDE